MSEQGDSRTAAGSGEVPVSARASKALLDDLDHLAALVTEREYRGRPELEGRYGPIGPEKSRQDARYHLSYLAQAVAAESPELYVDYLGWAKVVLARRNVRPDDLLHHMECLGHVVAERLPEDLLPVVRPILEAGIERLPTLPENLPSLIGADRPHAALAHQYLQALLAGDRHRAGDVIMGAVDRGVSVRDLYLHVFQQAQWEVGRLWQVNEINVAQEHYCTAATQLIMSRLYPLVFGGEKVGRTLVATCVAGDLHELGIRMVSDFFEMEGWDTYYLGANTPTSSVIRTLEEREADVLAVSATIAYHVDAVADLIREVRRRSDLDEVVILVGGYPFNQEPDLWSKVGADGYAADADEAIALANRSSRAG